MEEYGDDENGIPRLVIPKIKAYPFSKDVFVQLTTKSPEEVYFFMSEDCWSHPFALSKLLKRLDINFRRESFGEKNPLSEGDNYLLIGAGNVSRREGKEDLILIDKKDESVSYNIGPNRKGLVQVTEYLPKNFAFKLGDEIIQGRAD